LNNSARNPLQFLRSKQAYLQSDAARRILDKSEEGAARIRSCLIATPTVLLGRSAMYMSLSQQGLNVSGIATFYCSMIANSYSSRGFKGDADDCDSSCAPTGRGR